MSKVSRERVGIELEKMITGVRRCVCTCLESASAVGALTHGLSLAWPTVALELMQLVGLLKEPLAAALVLACRPENAGCMPAQGC